MFKFNCKICKYHTNDKSNFNKHKNTKKHKKKVEKNEKAIEEYKTVIQNNVIEQFQTGNVDWRFYSNIINNKMSLWIGGVYLVAMPVVKAVNEKRKLNKEKLKEDLNDIPDPKPKQNNINKQNFSEGSLKDNISKQYK